MHMYNTHSAVDEPSHRKHHIPFITTLALSFPANGFSASETWSTNHKSKDIVSYKREKSQKYCTREALISLSFYLVKIRVPDLGK